MYSRDSVAISWLFTIVHFFLIIWILARHTIAQHSLLYFINSLLSKPLQSTGREELDTTEPLTLSFSRKKAYPRRGGPAGYHCIKLGYQGFPFSVLPAILLLKFSFYNMDWKLMVTILRHQPYFNVLKLQVYFFLVNSVFIYGQENIFSIKKNIFALYIWINYTTNYLFC